MSDTQERIPVPENANAFIIKGRSYCYAVPDSVTVTPGIYNDVVKFGMIYQNEYPNLENVKIPEGEGTELSRALVEAGINPRLRIYRFNARSQYSLDLNIASCVALHRYLGDLIDGGVDAFLAQDTIAGDYLTRYGPEVPTAPPVTFFTSSTVVTPPAITNARAKAAHRAGTTVATKKK